MPLQQLWLTLGPSLTIMTALWLASLLLRDVSIVDIFWGPTFAAVGGAVILASGGTGVSGWIAQALVTIWAARLGVHIFVRHRDIGKEDHRYTALRRKLGARFPLSSLFLVFWLQALLLWVISWPLQAAAASHASPGPLAAAGWCIALAGLVVEAMADAQLAVFRSDPANAGSVFDAGLWRYSRHPNYFGDFLIWWGFFLAGLAAGAPWWTVLSPVVMSALLLHFSGIGLMEETISDRRPGYKDYVQSTSASSPGRRANGPVPAGKVKSRIFGLQSSE